MSEEIWQVNLTLVFSYKSWLMLGESSGLKGFAAQFFRNRPEVTLAKKLGLTAINPIYRN